MEPLSVILLGIVEAARKAGLLDHLKSLGAETASAAYEKLVQDKMIDSTFLRRLFDPEFEKIFEQAFTGIAPKNRSVRKRFVLAVLTEPDIADTLAALQRGELPPRQVLVAVFAKALPNGDPGDAADRFLANLKDRISEDEKKSLRVLLNLPEKMDEQLALLHEIRALLDTRGTDGSEPALKISTAKLPTTGADLFGREQELARLDAAWDEAHTNIFALVAWGGVGKTALVNHWLNHMAADNYRGAERVYAWSFFSQGTHEDRNVSADPFFNDALRWFGYDGPVIPSAWERGEKLAELVQQRRTLLILDGLEPLQFPPGEMYGRLKDQGLQALLKELARSNPGLCVLTTRVAVKDLDHTVGHGTKVLELEHLSAEAGAQLLRTLGVQGTEKELRQAAEAFGGHALALTLLGRYLSVVHGGEVRKRDRVPRLSEEPEQGGHARRVMLSYEKWLQGRPELDILYLMGLFDRPAAAGALAVLRAEPAIPGLTDNLQQLSEAQWRYAVQHLRELRLLAPADDAPDTLDCHPLVREHFGERLRQQNPEAWRQAHARLYDYYKSLPEKLYGKHLPDTLEEMEPLFAAVAHGCLAGKHQKALDEVYWERIKCKNEHYATKKLGAFGADLAALANFFDAPWDQPAAGLSEADKAVVLNWAGFRLRALGRLREAAAPMQAGMELQAGQEDWKNAASAAGNLSELFLTLGAVARAVDFARKSVTFADRSGDGFLKYAMRTALADALHHAGELDEAEALFRDAERLQQEDQPEYRYLYSLGSYRFCDLLLSRGKVEEVLERTAQTIEIAQRNNWLLDIALDHLSLGRAYLLQALSGDASQLEAAARHLDRAVTGLRESGNQDDLPRGLFARAALFRVQQNFRAAWDDFTEAQEIAGRGEMQLHLVDYHLESARVCVAERRADQAQQHAETAAELIEATGYHRRDGEVALCRAQVARLRGDRTAAHKHLQEAKATFDRQGIRMWDWEIAALEETLQS